MPVKPYDDLVTETDEKRVPGEPPRASRPTHPPIVETSPPSSSPGERRLAYPPSDRYRAAEAVTAAEDPDEEDPNASVARGVALATAVGVAGAVAIVVLGGVLTLTEVLLIVAGFTGLGVGLALRWGAGEHLAGRRRLAIALALSLGAVALGQLGLWQYGRVEGGVLGPLDYLVNIAGFFQAAPIQDITDEQWQRLQGAFPDGVCDYSKQPVGQQASIPWVTFADGPGGRPLGDVPRSQGPPSLPPSP